MMPEHKLADVNHLLELARANGLKFSYENGILKLNKLHDNIVDQATIETLKAGKEIIKDYFAKIVDESETINQVISLPSSIDYRNKKYFELSHIQRYWVDDNIDREYKKCDPVHGTITTSFKISGNINVQIFKQSVNLLVDRHESLRSSFHKIRDKYYLRVNRLDPLSEYFEFKLLKKDGYSRGSSVDDFIKFKDHHFILSKCPLFRLRLCQIDEDLYIFTIRIHHVIADTISITTLLDELVKSYYSLKNGDPVILPELMVQYKENISKLNSYIKSNRKEHRRHWSNLYPRTFVKVDIPGNNGYETTLAEKTLKTMMFTFSENSYRKITSASKLFNSSIFVILQATIKSYLFTRTGQTDFLFGTLVFGRQAPQFFNQIGCYSKTMLLRTIIQENDTISEIVRKTKKSNDDMNEYDAYSLREFLEETMPATHYRGTAFWNFNLQYNEARKSKSNNAGSVTEYKMEVDYSATNEVIPIDMQVHFKYANNLTFEVAYDSSRFNATAVLDLFNRYLTFVEERGI